MVERRTALAALATLPCAGLAGTGSAWAAADEAARILGSDAVLVLQRGELLHAYGETTRPMNLYSVRKSVLSVLFGMHVASGEIDLNATLASLGIDDKQGLSAAEKSATVRQLLQSRSGVYHPAAYEMAVMTAQRPGRGSHAPGTHWYYNNWDFNALGTIFQRRTGKTVFEAFEHELARPLQMQDFDPARHTRWVKENASDHPAYVMELSARDLARLGLLMQQGGLWFSGGQGRRLLGEDWVRESTTPYSTGPGGWQGYGYMWWVPQRAWPFWQREPGQVFHADGNFGQFLWVDRARELVIVHRTDGPRFVRRPIDAERVSPLLHALLQAAGAAA